MPAPRLQGVNDQPASSDTAGFGPYVRALAKFLMSEQTAPPLAVSIEGEWGSGKSSFLRQLQGAIVSRSKKQDVAPIFVEFNAWQHNKDEALWASFALEFARNIGARSRATWCVRFSSAWRQVRWRAVALPLALSFIGMGLLGVVITRLFFPTLNESSDAAGWTHYIVTRLPIAAGGPIALLWKYVCHAWPRDFDFDKYWERPNYESKIGFLETFQRDFAGYVKANLDNRRAFVFIDDLDRCEVPKAVELLHDVNLMLANHPPLLVVIAMDRRVIAAGVASRHRDIIRFLPSAETHEQVMPRVGEQRSDTVDERRNGIAYGYEFVEKFVQLQFRVPRLTDEYGLSWFLHDLLGTDAPSGTLSPQLAPEQGNQDAKPDITKTDGAEVERIMRMIAPVFDFNPRRLKQFLNLFRLRYEIAVQTRALQLGSTLPQLGKLVALELRWPRLIDRVIRHLGDLDVLINYPHHQNSRDITGIQEWVDDPVLRALLQYTPPPGTARGYELNLVSAHHLVRAIYGTRGTETVPVADKRVEKNTSS